MVAFSFQVRAILLVAKITHILGGQTPAKGRRCRTGAKWKLFGPSSPPYHTSALQNGCCHLTSCSPCRRSTHSLISISTTTSTTTTSSRSSRSYFLHESSSSSPSSSSSSYPSSSRSFSRSLTAATLHSPWLGQALTPTFSSVQLSCPFLPALGPKTLRPLAPGSYPGPSPGPHPGTHPGTRPGTHPGSSSTSRGLRGTTTVRAGMKSQPRGNLWRTRNLGRESMEVVQELKRVRDDEARVAQVLETKVARLLKLDMLAALDELMRQGYWQLTIRMLEEVRRESWYVPDEARYSRLMDCLGQNGQPQLALALFQQMQEEGMAPTVMTYTALIGAYCRCGQWEEALAHFRAMQDAGIPPEELTLRIMAEACEKGGATAVAGRLARAHERLVKENEFAPKVRILKH